MDGIIEALKQVPEVRLRIIKLAWQIVGEDGRPDVNLMVLHIKELKEAVAEAQAYSADTREAARCLREMERSKS